MARLRAERGRFIEEGDSHRDRSVATVEVLSDLKVFADNAFRPPSWYIADYEDMKTVERILRTRFRVEGCLSGPVEAEAVPLKSVNCKEPAPDGHLGHMIVCDACDDDYYASLFEQDHSGD